ncbi:hypothetical protein ISN75_12125 [Dyella marensis]|uniref:pilus assembly protein n=1 Tax=Dyella marensis TaxID=500610 RepID=UPI0031D558D8
MISLLRPLAVSRTGGLLLALALTSMAGAAAADTPLANLPIGTASTVPANMILALSVEYPTGTVAAYKSTTYDYTFPYLGYFDSGKCYDYDENKQWFTPTRFTVSASGSCISGGKKAHWSGNMLNWATMTALDEFRQSLTGGNRSVDSHSATVLLRSNLNSQSYVGNFPDRSLSGALAAATVGDDKFNNATVYLRSAGQGSSFLISDNANFSTDNQGKVATYVAAVRVCVEGRLESNCNSAHKATDYPNAGRYNKPEGLIQQNFSKIRVGAAGYAFVQGDGPANGAVRALIHDNGPTAYNGNGARSANPSAEWDGDTGIFAANPDAANGKGRAPGGGDASTTGAINYLNKFGYDNGYELYDTLGDLYWASLAYLMHVKLDDSYTKGISATNSMDVGFPVYGGLLPDPIAYTCQANAIVTIGDSHTWYDTRVPSSGGPTPSSAVRGALAPVNGADAAAYVDKLGNLPLIETAPKVTMASLFGPNVRLSTKLAPNGTSDSTYNMAGLAYFAHISDIRADLSAKQTVDTYTVDVLEPGPYDGTAGAEIYNPSRFNWWPFAGPNMYWLAAKYGGFDDVNGDGIPANMLTWHTNSTTAAGNDLRPDNYFPGNRPDLIQAGLAQIFKRVSDTSQSAAGPGVTSTRVLTNVAAGATKGPYYSPVSGFPVYTVSYAPSNWTGEVSGFVATAKLPGDVTAVTGSPSWSAQAKLDALAHAVDAAGAKHGWDTGRRIITSNGRAGVAFRYGSLGSSQQSQLSSDQVNYLRGDQSNEGAAFRVRQHILGDIVHSEAVLVQDALSPKYSEASNPGYAAFAQSAASRAPVVYVGANDGMLHAFAADFSSATTTNPVTGGGSELFAYVPALLYKGPSGNAQVDGLAALSNLNGVSSNNFAHHFYVDQTPQAADADFAFTATSSGSPPASATAGTANWHTMLVGGLGKGGKGYYALDVTTVPSAIDAVSSSAATETALASGKVLWEFTDSDMGFSYGKPVVAKTRKYGWVVLLTSGYNNASGHGHLYVVNARTGALLETLDTPDAGTPGNPSGLAQATAFTRDVTDNTVEQVYAGDLLGNVWRFDLSGTDAYPKPTLLATLTDGSKAQPVTTAPRVELDINASGLGTRRWVFVGTGKALDASDLSDSQQQTMYALRDGDTVAPSAATSPITRADLQRIADMTKGATIADSAKGWYYDLTGSAGANGGSERIVADPDAAAGTFTVAWATMTPSSDPCSLQGNIYAANFGTGQSALLDAAGNVVKSLTTESAPTKLQEVKLPNGNLALLYGQAGLPPQVARMRQGTSGNGIQRVNWREVLE